MTPWKDELPADLPRQRMMVESMRRGTIRRRNRRRRHAALLGAAGVLATVLLAGVLVPKRETDLRVGPASPSPVPAPPSQVPADPSPVPSDPAATTPSGQAPAAGQKIAFLRRTSPEDRAVKVFLMDADGSDQTQLAETTTGSHLQWSPDGTRFAFSDVGGIYVMNADGTGEKRLSTEASDGWPTWSPDGTKLAFRGVRSDGDGIYVMNADGSGQRRLTNGGEIWPAWSPDGKRIAFAGGPAQGAEISVMNTDGSGRRQLTRLGGFSDDPAWSPDGSKIAFRHRSELWVVNVDGTAPRSLVSPGGTMALDPQGSGANKLATAGGDPAGPAWSPDGEHIAYTIFHSGSSCSIWLTRSDGTGHTRLTDGSSCDGDPTWQPIRR